MKGPFKLGRVEGSHCIRDAKGFPLARVYDYKDAKAMIGALNDWFARQPPEVEDGAMCPRHNLPAREYVCPYDHDVNNTTTIVIGCATCEHEAAMDI